MIWRCYTRSRQRLEETASLNPLAPKPVTEVGQDWPDSSTLSRNVHRFGRADFSFRQHIHPVMHLHQLRVLYPSRAIDETLVTLPQPVGVWYAVMDT